MYVFFVLYSCNVYFIHAAHFQNEVRFKNKTCCFSLNNILKHATAAYRDGEMHRFPLAHYFLYLCMYSFDEEESCLTGKVKAKKLLNKPNVH